MSLLQEERQEGEREREEQQGLSSGNADRLTGLLRPAETNNQRREESGEGRDNRDTLAKVSAFIWPSPPASSRGAARASSPSAASNGGSGAGMARRRGGRERGRCDKEMLYGELWFSTSPIWIGDDELVVPSGSRLTVSMSRALLIV